MLTRICILIIVWIGIISNLNANDVRWDGKWEMSTDGELWRSVELPKNLHMEMEDLNSDEIYVRTSFMLNPSHPPIHPISMRMGIILDRDRFYLNGNLIHSTGIWDSDQPQAYDRIRIYNLPTEFLNKNGENKILVHIQKYFPDEIGPAQDRIEINYSHSLWKDFYYEEMLNLGFLIFYLAVCGYFLFLYLRRRKEKEYLFFSLFTLNLILYQFLRTQTKFLLPLEFWELKNLEYMVLPSFIPFMAHFIRSFLGFSYNRIYKGLDCISMGILFSVIIQTDIIQLDKWNRFMIQPTWGLYAIYSITLIYKRCQQKDWDAILLLTGIITIIFSALVDIFGARYVWNLPRLSGYCFMANVGFQALLLANRFVRLNREVEDLNQNLEEKVEMRTMELEDSLSRIEKIKNSQDGDYFLTSLLLKPLHKNPNFIQDIDISILTKQKKEFRFKDKPLEIGGDLTMVDEIELKSEKYIFFVNSDAMGKSIQGAGGALVLGVLVKSILSRQKASIHRSRYPEKWLKDCFLDLQQAFETFEGSMYTSLVIGLIHKSTGFLYYFNAEHPGIVVFNQGRSRFLDNEDSTIRKIGIPDNENSFRVSCYKPSKGDILIMGTDGRDDIDIGKGGFKIINEDENLFLRIVDSCHGNLENIYKSILESGRITDDISLLSIRMPQAEFFNPSKNKETMAFLRLTKRYIKRNDIGNAIRFMEKAYNMEPRNPKISEILGRLYSRLGSNEIAFKYFEKAMNLDPSIENNILNGAKCLKKLGMKRQALDLAERLKIRNPNNYLAHKLIQQLTQRTYITNHSYDISKQKIAA